MNPTTVRLSDTLLLSDCVGCDSVYRYGHANPVTWGKRSQYMQEAWKLGKTLDFMAELLGPYSVSYGYIHPALSRKIVKYQDPNKPSYHRWDHGAAVDLCFHDQVVDDAPIVMAAEVDQLVADYSRMITYSESQWVCFATRDGESKPRRAFYENRYVGTSKPQFITYSQKPESRQKQLDSIDLKHDWAGQGWPSYHGGGRRQLHHMRLGKYVVLSDLLYKARYVHEGVRNLPPLANREKIIAFTRQAERAARIIDMVIEHTGNRISIVSGYDHKRCWSKHPATFEFVPHRADARDVANMLCGNAIRAEHRTTKSGVERVKVYA